MNVRSKRIRELEREKEVAEGKFREELQALREELEVSREKINRQSTEMARLEVHKKKADELA